MDHFTILHKLAWGNFELPQGRFCLSASLSSLCNIAQASLLLLHKVAWGNFELPQGRFKVAPSRLVQYCTSYFVAREVIHSSPGAFFCIKMHTLESHLALFEASK